MRSWLNGYDDTKNADGRDYTNDSFRDDAFTAEEYAAVAQTTVVNAADPDFYAPGSNDTTDKVFLLSAADVVNEDYGFPTETVSYSGAQTGENEIIGDVEYTAESKQKIDDAIAAIDNVTYDESRSLDENKAAADAITARAKEALDAQRFKDCPLCGRKHNGGFFDKLLGLLHRLVYRLKPYSCVIVRILLHIIIFHVLPLWK